MSRMRPWNLAIGIGGPLVLMLGLVLVNQWRTVGSTFLSDPPPEPAVSGHSPNSAPVGSGGESEGGEETGGSDEAARAHAEIRGRVVTEQGEPVAGASLEFTPATVQWDRWQADPGGPVGDTITDGRGRFRIRLPEGGYAYWVKAEGFAPYSDGASTGDEVEIELSPGEEASIRVVDELGRPVEGAELHVLGFGGQSPRPYARSNEDGVIRYRAIRDSGIIDAPGYSTGYLDDLEEAAGSPLVMRPGFSFGGRVEDEEGKPVPGAHFQLQLGFSYSERVVSGEDGRFRVDGIPDVSDWVEMEADGFLPESFLIAPGETDRRVVLLRPRVVTGRVVFPDGAPAAGARVGETVTDVDGRFRQTDHWPGLVTIRAWLHPGRPDAWSGEVEIDIPTDGRATDVEIVLHKRARSWARVKVIGSDGLPAGGLVVRGIEGVHGRVDTDAQGSAVLLAQCPPGSNVTVEVGPADRNGPGPLSVRGEVLTAATPDGPEMTVHLPSPVSLLVIVRDAGGEPLPENMYATIQLLGVQCWRVGTSEHDRQEFRVHPADPVSRYGSPQVVIEVEGRPRKHVPLEVPPAGGVIEVESLPGATLTVRPRPGRPGMRFDPSVVVEYEGGDMKYGADPGPEGEITIGPLRAGKCRIHLYSSPENPTRVIETELRSGERRDLGAIELPPPVVIEGRVLTDRGRSLGGAAICQKGAMPGYMQSDRTAWSRADGTFRLFLPPFAKVVLLVTRTGRGACVVRLPAGEGASDLEIRLPAAGAVRVWPKRTAGSTTSSFDIRARFPGEPWTGAPGPGASGRFWLFEGLPPGPHEIVATSENGTEVKVVTVIAGRTVDLEIGIP